MKVYTIFFFFEITYGFVRPLKPTIVISLPGW